jgi:P2 family phage contractile tail tube protein
VPNFPLVLEYANLFCGSAPGDVNASNHLTLSELKLPTMEIQYVDHRAGGAPVAVEIDVVMTRLELEFEIVGITPTIMTLLRSYETRKTDFFAYGSLRDYMLGSSVQLEAIFRGQLAKVDPQPFRKGNVFHMKYQVRGLMNYELYIGPNRNPIYQWDFFQNKFLCGDQIETVRPDI